MLKMIKGAQVPDAEILNEGYEEIKNENYQSFLMNVNADKIKKMFEDFIKQNNEEVFLILEVPCNKSEEPLDENGNIIDFHSNIYYLDNIKPKKALEILNKYEELLEDGMIAFGFATHKTCNELMKYKYNVLQLISTNISNYYKLMKDNSIPKVEKLLTAWDTFKKENNQYGESTHTCDIKKILEELKEEGLYFYKQTITR